MTDPTATPVQLDHAGLLRLAKLAEPWGHGLLTDIRQVYGDEDAPTLHLVALGMLLSATLRAVPNAVERAPDALSQVFAAMGAPFSLDAVRRQ
jgi:hypothetical protein